MRRPVLIGTCRPGRDFNPRTREGCDQSKRNRILRIRYHFNPRTREGCDAVATDTVIGSINFNPRTREGCDVQFQPLSTLPFSISIHAPVKGATFQCQAHSMYVVFISIHAPVKGATTELVYKVYERL